MKTNDSGHRPVPRQDPAQFASSTVSPESKTPNPQGAGVREREWRASDREVPEGRETLPGTEQLATPVGPFDIDAEVLRYFDDSSLATAESPRIVILMGGSGAGKTRRRRERYSSGYVLVDAAEIFIQLSRGEYLPFPGPLERPLDEVGDRIARKAIAERRNIVTEIIGAETGPTKHLIDAMTTAGYKVSLQYVECDIEEAWQNNLNRGDDNISAYFAEPYQHRWLLEAANVVNGPPWVG